MSTTDIFDKARSACSRLLIESVAPGGQWKEDGDIIRLVELVRNLKPKQAAQWILQQAGHAARLYERWTHVWRKDFLPRRVIWTIQY